MGKMNGKSFLEENLGTDYIYLRCLVNMGLDPRKIGEVKYWRHPPEAKKSSIRNMVSASVYDWYERRTNECINTGRE